MNPTLDDTNLANYFDQYIYTDAVKLPPELDLQLSKIIKTNDPLDSAEFRPVEYINQLFPDEPALDSIDAVLRKLKRKMQKLENEIKILTRTQSDESEEAAEELQQAKREIETLFTKIKQIREKAAQSELMVQEITQDIKSLDYAKMHLTLSITMLKRLQMLVTALDQLLILSERRQYKESAQLLQAILQLIQHFKTYKSIPQIANFSASVNQLQSDLNQQVLKEFQSSFTPEGGFTGQTRILHDACLVADVLGETTKGQLVDWYCELHLSIYQGIFKPREEVSSLDNISRRYAWLKRLLMTYEGDQEGIFPPSWRVEETLCERFCDCTRKDLNEVLNSSPNLDVKILLKALQLTIEFESQLGKLFTRNDVKKATSDADGEQPSKFDKKVSTCFEPHLGLYIDAEDKILVDMIAKYKVNTQNADDDPSMTVLSSSTDLFYFYRETLAQCARFSTAKPFFNLCKLFGKYLIVYANEVLVEKLPKDEKKIMTLEEIRLVCLILNTADYCYITTSQLEEKLKEKIDQQYKEQVSLDSERETFLNTISICVRTLVLGVESNYEPALNAMMRVPWVSLDSVGDQSGYVNIFQSALSSCTEIMGKMISNKRYYKTFCDKFVEAFIPRYMNTVFKCKPICEVGAEQMLLDTHAIKTTLLELPSMGLRTSTAPSTTFTKLVDKGISKVVTILKVVMTPIDPADGVVQSYISLVADKNNGNFTRIIELKGLKKSELQSLVDAFQQRVQKGGDNLMENSNILSVMPPQTTTTTPISFSSIASTAQLPQLPLTFNTGTSVSSSNTSGTESPPKPSSGRFNDNFRRFMRAGINIRREQKDSAEKKDSSEAK